MTSTAYSMDCENIAEDLEKSRTIKHFISMKIVQIVGARPQFIPVQKAIANSEDGINDMAEACVFLMENVDADAMKVYCLDYFVNVGTGQDLTIAELAEMIRDIVGFNGSIHYDTSKPDGTPRKLLDVSKIRQLGWEPKVSLKEGIEKTYEWYNKRIYAGV